MKIIAIGIKLQKILERFLAWKYKRKERKLEKINKKHPLLDWIEAIFSALLFVILIQQFLFELYIIPTGSMIPTIDIGSRIAMEKLTFGPEIIPGVNKFPPKRNVKRGEIIMFENPDIPPMHPIMNILHKILYRISLTLINIDKDPGGAPRPRLLLKRVVAISGDHIRMRNGNVEIRPSGSISWITEEALKKELGIEYPVRRMLDDSLAVDFFSRGLISLENSYMKDPQKQDIADTWRQKKSGWYIPEDYFFPMGDNRDNSRDARYYGPVPVNHILGRALFRIWPPNKMGVLQ